MRPLGVVLVGFYQILRGVLGLVFGLSVLLFTDLAGKLSSFAIEGKAAGRFFGGFGMLAAVVVILFSVLHLVSGYGLLKMQNWGRLLAIFFSAIGLFLLLPVVMVAHGIPLAVAVINAAVIFYLAAPPVRRAFRDDRNPARAAA